MKGFVSCLFLVMLLSACAAPKPEYSESEKLFREMDLSRVTYVLGKISVKPKEAANNQRFVRKGYMNEDKIKRLLGEEMEKQLSLLDGDPRRNRKRVRVDVVVEYKRNNNFPFGDNIKNLEYAYTLTINDDAGKIREYQSRKEVAYYMFTSIPQSQKEFYAMEEKFIARIAGSIRERLGTF